MSLGIVFFVVGLVMNTSIQQKKEQLLEEENGKIIVENYQKVKEQVEVFSQKRQEMYEEVLNEVYLEQVPRKRQEWEQIIKEYEQEIEKIMTISNESKSVCETSYQEKDYNSKCDAITIVQEQVINSYVKDMEIYNEMIQQYNDMPQMIETEKEKPYQGIYQDYVDLNQDNSYEGKDE